MELQFCSQPLLGFSTCGRSASACRPCHSVSGSLPSTGFVQSNFVERLRNGVAVQVVNVAGDIGINGVGSGQGDSRQRGLKLAQIAGLRHRPALLHHAAFEPPRAPPAPVALRAFRGRDRDASCGTSRGASPCRPPSSPESLRSTRLPCDGRRHSDRRADRRRRRTSPGRHPRWRRSCWCGSSRDSDCARSGCRVCRESRSRKHPGPRR